MEQTTVHDLVLMYLNGDKKGFVRRVDQLIKEGDGIPLVLMLTNEHCAHLEHLLGHDLALAHVRQRAIEMDLINSDSEDG